MWFLFETPFFIFKCLYGRKGAFYEKAFKKFAAIGMAAMMIMAMGVTAFAANEDGSHEARLYKNGEFDSSNIDDEDTFSMGNGAIGDAVVTVDDEGNYVIVINLDENFTAYGMSGELTAVSSSDSNIISTSLQDTDGNGINDTLTIVASSYTFGSIINLDFTVAVWIMPVSSSGDLVIFE